MKNALLLFLAPLLLAGQTPAPPATLEGRVIDAATGQPVAGAQLRFGMKTEAVTGADGRFRITGVHPATYTLHIARAGFLGGMQNVKFASGQTLANWQVELVRAGEISGKVEDQDGWPAEGCLIQARRYVYHEGQRKLESSGQTWTNDLGEYWLGDLQPGQYYVRATPSGGLGFWDPHYGATFHLSATAMSDAVPVDLAPGQSQPAVANIRMLRRQGVRITGEVVLPDPGVSRHSGVGVSLVCEDYGSSSCMSAKVIQGAFTISDVPPGSYTLEARAGPANTPEGMEPLLAAYQPIDVGTSDLGGLVLKLEPQPPRDLPATVTIEADVKPEELQFYLQPHGASTIIELMKPDGSLIFHNILPGRYSSVHLGGVSPSVATLYLKSAHLGDEDILGHEFHIPNESSALLRLTVGALSMVVVEGVVTDAAGHPASQATVAFAPTTRRNPYSAGSTIADQTGAFSFSVPEGEYRIAVWKTVAPTYSFEDPGPLPQPDAQTVVLKSGANPPLKLSLAQ